MKPNPKNKAIRLSTRKFKALKDQVYARDRGCCQLCGKTTICAEYHHAVFRSQGGGDTLDNIITLCWKCHTAGIHGGGKDAQKLREKAVERMGEINGK